MLYNEICLREPISLKKMPNSTPLRCSGVLLFPYSNNFNRAFVAHPILNVILLDKILMQTYIKFLRILHQLDKK